MNADQLIRTLAADIDRREPPVKSVLAIALATGGAVLHRDVLLSYWNVPQLLGSA